MNTAEIVAELRRFAVTATTPVRDLDPNVRDWYAAHPLRKALSARGVVAPDSVVAYAMVEWLEGRQLSAAEVAIDPGAMWQITDDHEPVTGTGTGTERVEWGLQVNVTESPFKVGDLAIPYPMPVFTCDEALARHVAEADPDCVVVRRTITTYDDTVSPWEPVDRTEDQP